MAAPWKQKANEKPEYDQPPAGNHPAVMVAMVDLGTQINDYQGKKTRQRRAMCVWELVTEKDTNYPMEDRNFLVGIDLNLSCNEKSKFRLWVETRLNRKMPEKDPKTGEDFEYDFSRELGQPCLLSVKTNDKGYPKVDGMAAVPKGMTVPPAKTKPLLWSLDDLPTDGSEPDLPDWLPRLYGKRLADVIAECVELNPEKHGGETTAPKVYADADEGFGSSDGDIPF